jgi:hypothetical protein
VLSRTADEVVISRPIRPGRAHAEDQYRFRDYRRQPRELVVHRMRAEQPGCIGVGMLSAGRGQC